MKLALSVYYVCFLSVSAVEICLWLDQLEGGYVNLEKEDKSVRQIQEINPQNIFQQGYLNSCYIFCSHMARYCIIKMC